MENAYDAFLKKVALLDLNNAIQQWGELTKNGLAYRLSLLGIQERASEKKFFSRISFKKTTTGSRYAAKEDPLQPSLNVGYNKFYGQIDRVKISFARHGIFLEHGVGKGRYKGRGKEKPKPWIRPIMMVQVPVLADIVAKRDADRVAGQLKFLVPGIIDIKIDVK